MGVGENIRARKDADEVIELINDMAAGFFQDARVWFIELIRDDLVERYPLPKQDGPAFEPMNDEEAILFGKMFMPWGKHRGMPIDNVPMEYLDWILRQDDGVFITKLNRYMASRRIQSEQLAGGDAA